MKMNASNIKGFSLIEVMLAVLVLSVGILGVSKLQTSLIRSGSDANHRSIAASIAQRKVDDLRRFVYVNTSAATGSWDAINVDPDSGLKSPTSLAFANIADNKGGRLPSGTIDNAYELSWSSADYYYADDNEIASTTATTPIPAFKAVHVKVSWDGVGSNTNNVVSFDTIIDSYNLSNTGVGQLSAIAGTGPLVAYDPLAAPNVIPITLGIDDLKKETNKPLPDVSRKGDSTLIQFDTVTYAPDFNTQQRESFSTVSCLCTQAGAGTADNSQIAGLTTWDVSLNRNVDITYITNVSIARTVVDNIVDGQPQVDECTICCEDGPDVETIGDTTFKSCRLKRIDGILRILQPWQLVGFNIIPASYFNDEDGGVTNMTATIQEENIERYSVYVTALIRSRLAASKNADEFKADTTVNSDFIDETYSFTNNSGAIDHLLFAAQAGNLSDAAAAARDIQVRGVYMDYPPNGIYTNTLDTSTVPLDRVPFYEVNLTQLAGWIPDISEGRDQTGSNSGHIGDLDFTSNTDGYTAQHDDMDNTSCTQGDSPSFNRNHVTNEEFFFNNGGTFITCPDASRGRFNPVIIDVTTVSSQIYTSNDGLVDKKINNEEIQTVGIGLKAE